VKSGGQPGSLAAWKDAEVNRLSGDFFSSTLRTIGSSYLRPTHPGFIAFFRDCAPRAAAAIAGDISAAELADHVNRLYRETRQPERSVA
jgi:multiple sugar transport system substrate-binding protein